MKRLLLLLGLFVLLAGTATAALNNAELYSALDTGSGTTAFDNSTNGNDGTFGGNPVWRTGKIGPYAVTFDGLGDHIDYGTTNIPTGDSSFTMGFWMNTSTVDDGWAFTYGTDAADQRVGIITRSTTELRFFSFSGINLDYSYNYADGDWHFVVGRYNSSASTDNWKLYINGTEVASATQSGTNVVLNDVTAGWREQTSSNEYTGDLDNIFIYDRALTEAEINTLASDNPYNTAANITDFRVTAQDEYTTTSLNNFTADINGTIYTTTNGTIITNISSDSGSLYNITVSSDESGGYFNRTYTNYNVSTDLTAELHQSEVTFSAYNRVTGFLISELQTNDFEGSYGDWTNSGTSLSSAWSSTGTQSVSYGSNQAIYQDSISMDHVNTVSFDYNVSLNGNELSLFVYDNGTNGPTLNRQEIEITGTESGTATATLTGEYSGYKRLAITTAACLPTSCNPNYAFVDNVKINGVAISFTASTTSNGGSDSDSGINPTLKTTADNDFTASFSASGYYGATTTFDTTAQTTQEENFSVSDHQANFTINVLAGTATENNFTIDIYSDEHDFHEQLSTTSGNILANLTDGNYTVWLNDTYHALENYSVELNFSDNLTQVTLDVYTTNTVDIRFFDEETNALIDDRNITAYFTGDLISYNRTTSNGTLLLEMINPQDYEITYNADGYAQRQYSFTLTNRTFNELDLYLLNESNDELVLTSVQDSFLDPVPNAVIRAQKKNLSGTNYYTVETCTTDTNGECLLHLVLYDTTYRFLIIVDGVTVLTSADQTIKQSTLSFRVNLETDSLENINNILGITGSLFYDKPNSNIEFTWNDENSLGVTACLDIDTIQGASRTDYNLSCSTSASGTIILPIDTNLSYTYEAIGYVTVDGKNYELDRLTVAGDTLSSGLGINGLFIFGFIVIGIAAFTGLWNPVVGPIITAAAVWFFNYIGFITVGTAATTSLIIGAIMVAYLSRA